MLDFLTTYKSSMLNLLSIVLLVLILSSAVFEKLFTDTR